VARKPLEQQPGLTANQFQWQENEPHWYKLQPNHHHPASLAPRARSTIPSSLSTSPAKLLLLSHRPTTPQLTRTQEYICQKHLWISWKVSPAIEGVLEHPYLLCSVAAPDLPAGRGYEPVCLPHIGAYLEI